MLTRWGSFIYRRRTPVLALSLLSMVLAIVAMAALAGPLSSSGFVDGNSESQRVARQLADDFGRGREQIVILFDANAPLSDPATRANVDAALAPLRSDPRVSQVLTAWNGGSQAFVSEDGRSTYAVALLTVQDDDAETALNDLTPGLREAAAASGMQVSFTGGAAIGKGIAASVQDGLARAESVSIPATLILLVIVFGTLVAAGLPLLIALLSAVGSIALVLLAANVTDQSIFAINIISMLGLALGVDYSLFMVARFREELRTRSTEEAVARTMGTTGKAILFSGITVIFGLAATFFFPLPALRSMGFAGMAVVAMALLYGLTLLPAMLAILGPKVNRLNVAFWRRNRQVAAGEESASPFWHGVATRVMAQPVLFLVPTLLVILLAAAPFLRLDLTPGGVDVLPARASARVTYERIQTEFPAGESDPIEAVAQTNGDLLTPTGIAALRSYVDQAAALPHVTRVQSILTDPATAAIDWTEGMPGDPAAQAVAGRYLRGDATLVQVVSDVDGSDLDQVVRDLRDVDAPGLTAQVGGVAATSVDTIDGITAGLPAALLFVVIGSYLILLLSFGSLVLPLKAIVMTLLSIGASLGLLVLVFQDGHLSGLLGFTATGQIISTTPILMFCIMFGLSMDYEVLMLSRIQEEYQRTGNNRASVAFGLERTARTITSAAAIMVVAFGAFMLAETTIIKSFGFGLMIAVLIDATIVRALLVPSTMRLLGRWNWWAPSSVQRLVGRLGLSHVEHPATAPGAAD